MKEATGNIVKPWLRFIGDVHGNMEDYLLLADQAENSIQLGDLGFFYGSLYGLDSQRHRVLGGNHDNYEEWEGRFILQPPHFLGDFGVYTVPNFGDIFFVRGGYSIDYKYRKKGLDFFEAEQLSYAQANKALEMYIDLKPKFVISHECPSSIIELVSRRTHWDGEPIRPSMTARLLDGMWNNHSPETWLFGHHHHDWNMELRGTKFRCLAELSYIDYDKIEDK